MNTFCSLHNTPMIQMESRTKLDDEGQPKKYFAHHAQKGLCFGDNKRSNGNGAPHIVPPIYTDPIVAKEAYSSSHNSMYVCNAANNAMVYINQHPEVTLEDFEDVFNRILNILESKS